jgi:hypothetical protein
MPGEVLLRQGDPSDAVLFIRRGQVEVLRDVGAHSIPLGVVGELEYLGEMGVLERRARSATVRAVTEVEAEVIEGDDFLDRLRSNAKLGHRLVLRLSARLRDVEGMLDALHGAPPAAPNDAPAATVTLSAESLAAKLYAGSLPWPITKLPFVVGRRAGPREPAGSMPVDLEVADPEPYRLARAHFALVNEQGQVVVRDLGTPLGTAVDGVAIGRELASDSVTLTPGEHRILPGGLGSPYAFTITVGAG